MKTILTIFGGRSSEYAVSLQSAHAVLTQLPAVCRPLAVGITREGAWYRFSGDPDALPGDGWQRPEWCTPCTLRLDFGRPAVLDLDGSGAVRPFDAAFPVLHGKNGEDGTVQGLLALTGVPLIGCGVLSSAVCMDKHRAHLLAAAAGVPSPRGMVFRREDDRRAAARAAAALGYPLFVKPVRAGSSFGVSRVASPDGLDAALDAAYRHDEEALLEEAVPGFEVGCAVVGDRVLTVGAVDQVALAGGFFDYREKYTPETSQLLCPAPLGRCETAAVQAAARTVYRALDCRGFARVDFFRTPEGRLLFNEVNTIPGLTAHSRFPAMMAAAGVDFPSPIRRLAALGDVR